MYVRYGVRLVGITYLALGVIGFLPIDALHPFHGEGVGASYLLGLIAVNWLHNLIHLAIGAFGIWASSSLERSRLWGWVTGVTLLLVFAAGMAQASLAGYPADQLLLGLVPLNSPGHMLHLATGGLALYLALAHVPKAA